MYIIDSIMNLLTANLKWILPICAPLVLFFLTYLWKRRWCYYYGYKFPGPIGFPILGCLHLLKDGPLGVHKFLKNLFAQYPSVVGFWMGPDFYVSTTEPNHLKYLLTNFLDKGNFYHLMSEYFQRALAAAPVQLWKQNRKNINPTFNVALLNTFVDTFAKHADNLVEDFQEKCNEETEDIFPRMWKCTLDAGCETLGDVDSKILGTKEFLPTVFRIEEILMQRFFSPTLHLDILWNLSSSKTKLIELWKKNCLFVQQILDLMKPSMKTNSNDSDASSGKKKFLEHLVQSETTLNVPHDYVLEEGQIMLFVGTETSAVALSSVLLVLGMYPDVQKEIDKELKSIFGTSDRKPTLDDVNQMDYLERVIKETLRLLPPIPFILRTIEKNVQLGSYTFPAGAAVFIPLPMVHRKPEIWSDPERFDPDRFLPEEVEKRPPCSFMPFSYGIRNCIGYKYALLSLKVILSTFLRHYTVKSSNYDSVEDMDLIIHVVAKPKKGYKITLEKKCSN